MPYDTKAKKEAAKSLSKTRARAKGDMSIGRETASVRRARFRLSEMTVAEKKAYRKKRSSDGAEATPRRQGVGVGAKSKYQSLLDALKQG